MVFGQFAETHMVNIGLSERNVFDVPRLNHDGGYSHPEIARVVRGLTNDR